MCSQIARWYCWAFAVFLVACGDSSDGEFPTLDQQVRSEIAAHEHSADPASGRQLPAISEPLPQLGMKLFFSRGLSGQTDTACVSCHHPVLGGSDALSLPIGVDADVPELLGPGRTHSSAGFDFDGGPTVPRNSPTTFNIALWDGVLFHDGRVESLGQTVGSNGGDDMGVRTPDSDFGTADPNAENLTQAQALFPVTSMEEMRAKFVEGGDNQQLRDALVARFVDQSIPNSWLAEFQSAFNSNESAVELITYANIATAIAEYERSQVFVATPWKAYVEGSTSAISTQAKRGALLFFRDVEAGGAGCVGCHSGDFFTDEAFHVLAFPQLGRGKGDGPEGDADFGRFRETGVEDDRFAFRTPSLINVSVTGPYGHAGAFPSLEASVRHHLDPGQSIDDYDFHAAIQPGVQVDNAEANTREALAKLRILRAQGRSALPEVDLSDAQVADLLAFLEALTDPCVEDRDCLSSWIPDTSAAGPDGLQLNAVDKDNKLL